MYHHKLALPSAIPPSSTKTTDIYSLTDSQPSKFTSGGLGSLFTSLAVCYLNPLDSRTFLLLYILVPYLQPLLVSIQSSFTNCFMYLKYSYLLTSLWQSKEYSPLRTSLGLRTICCFEHSPTHFRLHGTSGNARMSGIDASFPVATPAPSQTSETPHRPARNTATSFPALAVLTYQVCFTH